MTLRDELRYAARALARRKPLLFVTIATLSIGIAANSVMFAVVDQLLLRPAPGLADAHDLRRIYYSFPSQPGKPTGTTTYPVVAALTNNVPGMETAAFGSARQSTLGEGPDARAIQLQIVSGNFFSMLGVLPQSGRWFSPDEARIPVGEPVAVVSDGFWRSQLGGTDVRGRVLFIDGRQFSVIGIAPPNFTGVDRAAVDVWLPISAVATTMIDEGWYNQSNAWWVQAIARLKPGVAEQQAETQSTIAFRNEVRSGANRREDTTSSVVFGSIIGARHPAGVSAESKVSLWLMGVSVLVLLIACANVANLLIVRAMERQRELAVRLALGAGLTRLIRMLLVEAALLAGVAGVVAIAVTIAAGRAVQQLLLPNIVWSGVVDLRMLAFTLAIIVACALLAGIAPALAGAATPVSEGLKAGALQTAGGRGRVRHVLLAVQAALSIVLLIGAGLFTRSLRNVAGRDVGIDFERTMLVSMDLRRVNFARSQVEEVYRLADERISALPGVASVAMTRAGVPLRSGSGMSIKTPGMTERPKLQGGGPYYSVVTSDYFATLGTRIVRGRGFTEDEDRVPSRSLIINKVVADAYWPGQDPLGQCAYMGSDSTCSTVVGITESAMLFRLIRDDRALLYVPAAHPSWGNRPPSGLIVRTSGDPKTLVPALRQLLQSLAPNMPFVAIEPYNQMIASQLQPWRLGAAMFTVYAALALIIAAIGLYSVMAYTVSQRTREIGVRMALGAQSWDVVRLVAWQSSRATLTGLALGTVVALVASRWVTSMLYETSPRDPLIYLGAALVLALAAAVASIVPARRSAAVDPVSAIRAD